MDRETLQALLFWILLFVLPALVFMSINNLLYQPLAWVSLVGMSVGVFCVWLGTQTYRILQWIGVALFIAGFAANIAMDM